MNLTGVELLGVLENVFDFEGRRPGHEIVVVYAAEVADRASAERDAPGPILDEGTPVRGSRSQMSGRGVRSSIPTVCWTSSSRPR
ncbi:hypothetical protein [Actinomycetospora sp. NBRC 106378]|uniref:hypothetical protein n=1 Tax=Actinomycetospora sp. NBRC 106378 TaxID=3032208 RepID=UPI0024A4D6C6|nr:hypothetical protein [Actinomycetospora sp. NBRC 106378]GLZ55829.1 hypothetical protein Acsp07_54460 [Actinomycetospora sp. NBRC 106378]